MSLEVSMSRSGWPRWSNDSPMVNLREVAPRLWVGAYKSQRQRPDGKWGLVVDLYGVSKPWDADVLLSRPFDDGEYIPDGLLDEVEEHVWQTRHDGKPVLIHCQAGVSRSVSIAYAMLRVIDGLSHEEALRRVKADPDYPRKATLRSAVRWVDGGS